MCLWAFRIQVATEGMLEGVSGEQAGESRHMLVSDRRLGLVVPAVRPRPSTNADMGRSTGLLLC